MTIVVTGGSGFVGTALAKTMLAKGYTVIIVAKHGPALTHENLFFIPCDLERETLPFNVLERTDAVIHLAGKHTIDTEPNTDTTTNVIKSLAETKSRPPIFISASSVSYYGPGYERELDERSAAGTTEIAKLIEAQEQEALKAEQYGCRVIIVRTAPVIGADGGFIEPLLHVARFHVAFRMGKEDFWMPWIHINDLIHVYMFALETNTLQGIVNAAAPIAIKYNNFMKAFTAATKSIIIAKPPFMKWPYNSKIRETMTNQKIVPQRLIDKGFAFAYTNITEAIADAMYVYKHGHEKN
jgi:uncharacterized protein (TIGR01777 family)